MLKFSQVKSISEICKTEWKNLVEDANPFLNYNFFMAMERSGCTSLQSGWEPNHFLITDKNTIVGLIPNFKKNNSYGEYIFDQSWANAYASLGMQYYPKFLSAIPFTPINSKKLFFKKGLKNLLIFEELKEFLNSKQISSCHFNFVYRDQSTLLEKNDFLTRKGIQYHWYNKNYNSFQDFLDRLKRKKKKNIIKERNFIFENGIRIEAKVGKEISDSDLDFFYDCYLRTIDKKWANKYLNLTFFHLLFSCDVVDQMLIFIARDKNKQKIASALSFFDDTKLFGRYWGSLIDVPFLHFELCYYQSIEFAIKNKINLIESGAQGEHKIARGYEPSIVYSNHWIKDKKIKIAIKEFLLRESGNIDETFTYLKKLLPYKD